MTIDERVEQIIKDRTLPPSALAIAVRTQLLEVARDQRHACAEAVLAVDRNAWSMDAAHNAVMNAPLK